jgi:two-component system, NtrC family, nitrogen regulation response regulator NtrX
MRSLKSQLDKVTRSNGRVMLTGPAGGQGNRRALCPRQFQPRHPFVSVNSASVEPDRMEEVLFGRESPERGIEPGLLEQANGGVIFFDEVADMPLGTQSKILRVLVDQQFQRVGGSDRCMSTCA